MSESPLNSALRQFEATEANLVKAETLMAEIEKAIPEGIAFGQDNGDFADLCRGLETLLVSLPKIDGWKPKIELLSLDDIAQMRLDAKEVGEIECEISVERTISEPALLLREYRYRFAQKRRHLIRHSLVELIDEVDASLSKLKKLVAGEFTANTPVQSPGFQALKANVAQINTLLGSSIKRPPRWGDLHRHLHFGVLQDLSDIIRHDWPAIAAELRKSLYGEHEPVPIDVEDLGDLVSAKPGGRVATKLLWPKLTEDDFERLVFALISAEPGYENPEWLMKTNATDRGRDLSVYRVQSDALSGTSRSRVVIQCKHWLSKSVGAAEVATLIAQMKLWDSPRVDVCTIATSGRFSSDAVTLIEKHNHSDTALKIEMWPESHLERLLACRPAIIGEFALR